MKILEQYRNKKNSLFHDDIVKHELNLSGIISDSTFLVLGGAGTIGQEVVKQLFKRQPKVLHVVDISENNLVELVRDVRSKFGYIKGDFKTFALDVGSKIYDSFIKQSPKYDYIFNLSALKHVRSEKDRFTLMRMIDVNILNVCKTLEQAIDEGTDNYFCVSTDKASEPVNMMGASKRIMEQCLNNYSCDIKISSARFANVAFSDGSLLYGFENRIKKNQPIVAPCDISRYFISPEESGQLCLIAALLGKTNDIFFPKLNDNFKLIKFSDLASDYVRNLGYEPYLCQTEDEARSLMSILPKQKKWPCLYTISDTTGEKKIEEFYNENDLLDLNLYDSLGIIKTLTNKNNNVSMFLSEIKKLLINEQWQRSDIIKLFKDQLPEFKHKESGKFLDGKM